MLRLTCNPVLIIDTKDFKEVDAKITELNIEIVSKHERLDQTSLHIYADESTISKLIEWLTHDYNGLAELEK